MSRRSQNEKCGIVGIIGGILMAIGGVTGAATWQKIGDLAIEITGMDFLGPLFQVLVALGALGGLLVILGAAIIGWTRHVKGGKLLIAVGAGFGLLGLLVFVLFTLLGDDPFSSFLGALSIGFVGLICSIYARQKAR